MKKTISVELTYFDLSVTIESLRAVALGIDKKYYARGKPEDVEKLIGMLIEKMKSLKGKNEH